MSVDSNVSELSMWLWMLWIDCMVISSERQDTVRYMLTVISIDWMNGWVNKLYYVWWFTHAFSFSSWHDSELWSVDSIRRCREKNGKKWQKQILRNFYLNKDRDDIRNRAGRMIIAGMNRSRTGRIIIAGMNRLLCDTWLAITVLTWQVIVATETESRADTETLNVILWMCVPVILYSAVHIFTVIV